MKERVYVCHTFYHVYITVLKELELIAIDNKTKGKATIVLSKMSIDFGDLQERLEMSQIFDEVYMYDEKLPEEFKELDFFKENQGNIVKNMIARIRFTKLLAKLEAPYVPVDMRMYQDIYVYCDSDPIGYYLNQYKIPYHAIEDGLNCLSIFDAARCDNRGAFPIKVLMSKLNYIFIQNGYGKYCRDMEVNDLSVLKYQYKKYKEVPRDRLVERLNKKEKELLIRLFVKDQEKLQEVLGQVSSTKKKVVILTEPLYDTLTRKKIFRDIIEQYGQKALVVIKQHPRDDLSYEEEFPEYLLIEKTVPMEILNFISEDCFDQVISVLTQLGAITFAKEKIMLGVDFLDKYDEEQYFRMNDHI